MGVFWVSAAGVPALARQIRVSRFPALPARGRAMLLRPAAVVFQPLVSEPRKGACQGTCMHGAAWVARPAQRAAQLPVPGSRDDAGARQMTGVKVGYGTDLHLGRQG